MKKSSHILKKIKECPQKIAIYNKINPILFDVSLRDGIQNAKIENFPTDKKMSIFHTILTEFKPKNIEIGSLTSPKILPIMNDSLVLHNYVSQYLKMHVNINKLTDKPIPYVLIPSEKKLYSAMEHNIKNFSFITSISEQFQIRNTKKTLKETKEEFDRMFSKWFGEPEKDIHKKKLYISCINSCPILGKIDNDFILKEILFYHAKYEFNELCLSDTMGTLNYDDFEYIIDSCLLFGVPPSKISLHFHCSNNNYENLEKIIHYCFTKNLNKFDISMLDTGGCPVTMNSEQLSPNLSYDMFYKIIDKYIEKKLL